MTHPGLLHRFGLALTLAVALGSLGCESDTLPADLGPGIDAAVDGGCGPTAPSGSDPQCVFETCFGGLTCVNGPCPFDCCTAEGTLDTCFITDGYECNVAPAVECGGGTCVQSGETCP